MKKRLMLMVVFGVSFTPAVFARDTGENRLSDIDKVAIHCANSTQKSLGEKLTRISDSTKTSKGDSNSIGAR
jgi:hypothetical protein